MSSGLGIQGLGLCAGAGLMLLLPAGQESRPAGATLAKAPLGFRALPSPPGAWTGPVGFAARAERGALWMTARDGKRERLGRLSYLPHGAWSAELLAELPAAPPLPARSLGFVPLAGDRPAWTVAIAGRGRAPMLLLPSATPSLARFAAIGAGAPLPVATDLDRSGRPELWFRATRPSDPASGFAALPRVRAAVGTPEADEPSVEGAWFAKSADSTEILAYDLDRDLFEELCVCRRGAGLVVLRNRGGLDFEAAAGGLDTLGETGIAPKAARLRLGPERGELQWGLAWAADGSALVLLSRKAPEAVFTAEAVRPAIFARLRALDARIADLDADGRDELWLLARDTAETGQASGSAELFRFDLAAAPGEAPSPAGRSAQPGARTLRLGDLDGDGSIDLVLPRESAPPYVYANEAFERSGSLRLTLEDRGARYHAVGSYVELHDGAELVLRRRWPPLSSGDQCQLWLSWDARGARAQPELRVTWADGNSVEVEYEAGAYLRVRR